jgi:UDP:flavonoid glycosyltransferase YjiC (YdhE family)
MRVLFAVSPWPGHYFPMVPLAWALRAAGHDVHVLCSSSDVDPLTHAGLTPVPALDGLDVLRGARLINVLSAYQGHWPYPTPPLHPDTGEPLDLSTFDLDAWRAEMEPTLTELSRQSTDAAVNYARWWRPHLVVHDLQSLEGPLVAKVTGVPDVLHLWGPVGTDDPLSPVGGDGPGDRGGTMPTDFSDAYARHGVGEMSYDLVDYVLDPSPEAIRPAIRGHRLPMRFVPYNGPGAAPIGLPERSGRPRVCVVWGRSGTKTFGATVNKVPQVVEAATALDAEVLLLVTPEDARDCGPLPESVRLLVDVPMHLVLPGCDAVVHYGGGGATMTSIVAGVPQLILPCGYDQPLIAGRVAGAGCGLDIPNHAADTAGIKVALDRLLGDPAFALAARELAASSEALPAPSHMVGVLEQLCAAA